MKIIRLKKRPSFYEDLSFSQWLQQDLLLGVALDSQNRVIDVRLDRKYYTKIFAALKVKRYLET